MMVTAIAARLIPGPRTIDDAYITFRYARNILAGNGFVFNPGERVLGTTTPLYTAWLVLWGAIGGGTQAAFPTLAMVSNAVFDAICCWLIYRIGKRLGAPNAGLAAAFILSIAPFSVTFAIGGLETSLYCCLLLGLSLAHLGGRNWLAAFLSGLAFLTRPDALILILPLGLERLRQVYFDRGKSPIWRDYRLGLEAAAFSIPVAAWLIFANDYFGNPLPHSIAAKSVAYLLPRESALVRLLQHYATPFMDDLTLGELGIGIGLFLYPSLYVVGALAAFRNDRVSWPFLTYPWLYFAAFAIANPLVFRWYLTPILPFYFLGILMGVNRLLIAGFSWLDRSAQKSAQRFSRFRMALLALFLFIVPAVLTLHGWTLYPDHGLTHPAPKMAWYKLELLYRQAAEVLNAQLSAERDYAIVLAAGDVGVLGYYTPTRILDTVGLNSAVSTRYYPLPRSAYAINYAIPPGLIFDQAPDWIIILEVYGRSALLKEAKFHELYRLRQKLPTDIYGSDGMLIFERKAPQG